MITIEGIFIAAVILVCAYAISNINKGAKK